MVCKVIKYMNEELANLGKVGTLFEMSESIQFPYWDT